MKYNYVYFNNPSPYDAVCLKDVERMANVHLVSFPLDYASYPVRQLFRICHSVRLRKIISQSVRRLWYPYYFKNNFKDNKPICFVSTGERIPLEYISYLRNKYPNCRAVVVNRDLIKKYETQSNFGYTLENMKKYFDIIFSYDKIESEKYGLSYFSEIESKIDVRASSTEPLYDVFFAGKAKDRLPRLLRAYKIFTKAGLSCNFYLVEVPTKQRIKLDGIEYSDKLLPYTEMLQRSLDARCILEINQYGAVGYTSRFLEAVMYNRKLITDNLSIKEDKFYNPEYIQCIDNVDNINPEFVKSGWESVNFNYKDEFSPIHLIEQIDRELYALDLKKEHGNAGN